MTRCTCVYRPSTVAERDAGAAVITVESRDPWCPADALHDRVAAAATTPAAVGPAPARERR
jgi:hypothetical protein